MTITIERAVLAKIRRVAGPRGVSRFINASTKEKLARLDILAVLDDLDAKHGHATKAERAAVDRDMRRIFRR